MKELQDKFAHLVDITRQCYEAEARLARLEAKTEKARKVARDMQRRKAQLKGVLSEAVEYYAEVTR